MNPPDRAEAFIELLAEHESRITTYCMTLVPNWNDAEDILQEAKVAMWREFENFELGTNFGAWACKVVFYRVLAYRKKRQREKLRFSDAFLETVSDTTLDHADQLDTRAHALSSCIAKLNDDHRSIIRMRYFDGMSIDGISSRTRRAVGAVYRVLSRIRRNLHDCVNQQLASETES